MNTFQNRPEQQASNPTFNDDEIRSAFQTFDLDKNMFIGVSEIRHILSLMGESATDEEVDEMIRLCDPDGIGQATFDGFYRLFGAPVKQTNATPVISHQASSVGRKSSSASLSSHGNATISELISEYSAGMDINPAYIRKVYKRFQTADKTRAGRIGYQDFLQVLESDDNALMKKLFDMFDVSLMNEIDVKQFIVNLIINSKSIKLTEKVKIAFSMVRTATCPDNALDRPRLIELLGIYFSGFPEERTRMDMTQRADAVFRIAGASNAVTIDQLMDAVMVNPDLVLPPIMSIQVERK